MLYIVLALVLAAFGLLIAALTTANTLWAWISVVVSVVAAALLVMDWVNGRRRRSQGGEPSRSKAVMAGGSRHRGGEPEVDDDFSGDLPDDRFDDEDELLRDDDFPPPPPPPPAREPDLDFEPTSFEPVVASGSDAIRTVVTEAVEPPAERVAERAGHRAEDRLDDVDSTAVVDLAEPGEEPTDASDLLVVAGLNAEVRVVDEHPRYHLATCVWLANRPTIPIPVSEARQLGFTPCSRCAPDSVLAARHRAAR